MKVVSSCYHAQPRIVEELEKLLKEARAGRVTAIFLLHEDDKGNVTRSNDGFSEQSLVFAIEGIKHSILSRYYVSSATPTAP